MRCNLLSRYVKGVPVLVYKRWGGGGLEIGAEPPV